MLTDTAKIQKATIENREKLLEAAAALQSEFTIQMLEREERLL